MARWINTPYGKRSIGSGPKERCGTCTRAYYTRCFLFATTLETTPQHGARLRCPACLKAEVKE